MSVRRAFLFSASERYVVMVANFLMVAIVARILTPEAFGFAVIGTAVIALVETFRDFGALSFIVQKHVLLEEEARSAATIMLLTTLFLAAAVWIAASPLAGFYGQDGVRAYLRVIAFTLLGGAISGPLYALLQRDMKFGAIAFINVASALSAMACTILLALLGASYMSFAWGSAVGALTAAVLALVVRRDLWIFRPCLRAWRVVLSFGSYWIATGFLNKLHDYVPALVLGRSLGFEAMGLYSRAAQVSQLPDKCVLAGVLPIALPAMASEAREGRSLKAAYLLSLSYITVLHWPALVLLILLAHPIVLLMLGDQWLSVVPLVQIMGLSLLPGFLTVLAYPLMVAAGGVRDTFVGTLITVPLGTLVTALAALHGVEAAALSLLITNAFQAYVWLHFIRRYIPFAWSEVATALSGSVLVCAGSMAVPLGIIALNGFRFDVSLPTAMACVAGAAVGWAVALALSRHPFRAELDHLLQAIRRAAAAAPVPVFLRRRLRVGGIGR